MWGAWFAPHLMAQDVTVGDPVWFMAGPPPETMPWLKPGFVWSLSRDVRAIKGPAYAICTRYSDPTGQDFLSSTHGTHLALHRFVERELREWNVSVARSNGRAVASRVWFPVIFNPKSASKHGGEATPRLLAVAPAIIPADGNYSGLPVTVPMRLTLDNAGRIVAAESVVATDPIKLAAVRAALTHWKFAPARKAGQAVPAEVQIPVACVPHDPEFTPPLLLGWDRTQYPFELRKITARVEVDLEFEIDATGQMGERRMTRSTHPAFNADALASLSARRYAPAQRGGMAVASKWNLTLTYHKKNDDPSDSFLPADLSKIPAARRYDIPPKIRGEVAPVYPHALLQEQARGKATALIAVDVRGEASGINIAQSDRREFGFALAAALEGFLFDPALKDGTPVEALVRYEHAFHPEGSLDRRSRELLAEEGKHPDRIRTAGELDRPLRPTMRVSPIITLTRAEPAMRGEAVVELLVDEEGRALAETRFRHPRSLRLCGGAGRGKLEFRAAAPRGKDGDGSHSAPV